MTDDDVSHLSNADAYSLLRRGVDRQVAAGMCLLTPAQMARLGELVQLRACETDAGSAYPIARTTVATLVNTGYLSASDIPQADTMTL